MVTRIAIIFLIASAVYGQGIDSYPNGYHTVGSLFNSCELALIMTQGNSTTANTTPQEMTDAVSCVGYIAGFIQGALMISAYNQKPFCIPLGEPVNEIIFAVYNDMRELTRRNHGADPAWLYVIAPLKRKYPCNNGR